jgi:putative oxidoreductase
MDIALLALRLVVGLTLAAHGAQKLFGAFGGPGIDRSAGLFEQIGLRPGKLYVWIGAGAELVGGVMLAAGLLTPFAAAALIAGMTAAALTVHLRNGFFLSNDGVEYLLVLAAAAFALAGVGPGAWSLDHALNIHASGTGWALAALAAGALGGVGTVLSGRVASRRGARHGQPRAA